MGESWGIAADAGLFLVWEALWEKVSSTATATKNRILDSGATFEKMFFPSQRRLKRNNWGIKWCVIRLFITGWKLDRCAVLFARKESAKTVGGERSKAVYFCSALLADSLSFWCVSPSGDQKPDPRCRSLAGAVNLLSESRKIWNSYASKIFMLAARGAHRWAGAPTSGH